MGQRTDSRKRIVAAAMDLFHERGYTASSVQTICAVAEVGKGSFYHFFHSKRDLALEVLDSCWTVYRDELYVPAFSRAAPPLERISRLFNAACESMVPTPTSDGYVKGCALGNLAMELSTQDAIIRRKCADIFERSADHFEGVLSELSSGPEVRLRAEALVAYFQGAILLAKTNNDPNIIRNLAGGALQIAVPPKMLEPALAYASGSEATA